MHYFDFTTFYQLIAKTPLSPWLETLPAQLAQWQKNDADPRLKQWMTSVSHLPHYSEVTLDLKQKVHVSNATPLTPSELQRITHLLMQLAPWRKGPFEIHGIHVDAEWRSDLKWDRLAHQIKPLQDKYVLDVGCNSGYYLWRMVGAGAKLAVGIDPMSLFLAQFEAIRHLLGHPQTAHFIPVGIEALPPLHCFDTVFSMGVLYHRRSPFDHFLQLKQQLVHGGELVLETLVIEGDEQQVLVPSDRYAQMRNVYFIPSIQAVIAWLKKAGFKDVRVIDISTTDPHIEQRKTAWMTNDSLIDFLDPQDHSRTIEGYPAPKRAVFTAIR